MRLLIGAAVFAGGAVAILGIGLWLFDAADVPSPADESAIVGMECRTWRIIAPGVHGITIVQRNSYAAASTNIDVDNLALYRQAPNGWQRITPKIWLNRADKVAFWKAGAPLLVANALVNGLRRQRHRWNPSVILPHC